MEIYWNESKYEKVSTPKGFIWETKLAANSLIWTKESIYIGKEFNSHKIGLEYQQSELRDLPL